MKCERRRIGIERVGTMPWKALSWVCSDAPDRPIAPAFTRDYLWQFDAARKSASSADELIAEMKRRFPDAAFDLFLRLSAQKAFASAPVPAGNGT